MMKNIISIYLLAFGIYLITPNTAQMTTNKDETTTITFVMERTSPDEIDQALSTETPTISIPIYIITNFTYLVTATTAISKEPVTSILSTTTTMLFSTTRPNCNASTQIQLPNNTCASKIDVQIYTVDILRDRTGNSTVIADALSLYISSVTNTNISSNPSYILSADEIDELVSSLTNVTLTINSNTSFLMVQQPNQDANVTILGASYAPGIGGQIISSSNENNVYNSDLTAAAIVQNESLIGVTFLNMFIIDKPTTYENIDNSSNQTLASSVIVVAVQRNSSALTPMNISLYFQVLNEYRPTVDAIYLCSYYDTNNGQWNDSGCSEPQLNAEFNRYECSCNHLTSFALIWLPQSPSSLNGSPPELDAQDKASIAFQLLSIICFLGIIIHGITVRIMHSQKYTQSRHLLPLISCGITMILFIFYIALGLTVYNRYKQSNTNIETTTQQGRNLPTGLNSRADSASTNSSSTTNACLSNEHALMFIVYFLIIFMFCSKTSIGFYNYRHYVKLFPPPSPLLLAITIGISFLISIIWLSIAAGLNSNSSNDISEVYLGKICWFTRSVIHYFLTIPICLFLAINLAMFIPVVKHNITHANIEENERSNYIRRKECIYILLSSAITQGFGWLFGPMMLIASPNAAEVLGWLFIIFNGLEGVWAILLYIVIEKEGIENTQRYTDDKDRDLRHDDHDVSEFELDVANIDKRPDQLAIMRSDSPRNSFANFPASKVHHLHYQVNDTDQLT